MSEHQFDEPVPEQSEQLDQLQPEDTLIDRGVDDVLDEGYITPDHWSPAQEVDAEQTLDDRLKQEVPDDEPDTETPPDEPWADEQLHDGEVGRERAGRLVDAATADNEDIEPTLIGEDVGFAGGAASAEEAAVHVVDDGPDDSITPG